MNRNGDRDRERNDHGQYTPKFTDTDLFNAVRDNEPATTTEIARELDVTRQAVSQRIGTLEDDGVVEKKDVGSAVIWMTTCGGERGPPREAERPVERVHDPIRDTNGGQNPTPEKPDHDPIARILEYIEIPAGREDEKEAAIRAAIDYLETCGRATKEAFVKNVMTEHPAGYDVEKAIEQCETEGERYRGAWWRRVVKPALKRHPNVESPPRGGSEWVYKRG